MKIKTLKILSAATLAAMLVAPGIAGAAGQGNGTQVQKEGMFTAEQKGQRVYVSAPGGQLYETKGPEQLGKLKDLFVIFQEYEFAAPLIVVETPGKKELRVFSDLWWKFNDGTYEDDRTTAYDSGRIFYEPKEQIVSKTAHHYAVQEGDDVVVYIANDYDDLSQGYHIGYTLEGTLRGLVIYDCCPYAVVERDGVLSIHGLAEDENPVLFDYIELD